MYLTTFWILVVVALLAHIYTRKELPKIGDAVFKRLRRRYLVIYLLAMAGDWLQGPVVILLRGLFSIGRPAFHSYGLGFHSRV